MRLVCQPGHCLHTSRTLFAQVIRFLPGYELPNCVTRYNGDRSVRSFTCWYQLLRPLFAQLTCRESLCDIVACWRAVDGRLYLVGSAELCRAEGWPMRTSCAIGASMPTSPKCSFASPSSRVPRGVRPRRGEHRLCVRLDNHRSLHVAVSVGPLQVEAARDEAAQPAGPPGQYNHASAHFAGAPPRCQRAR